MYIHSFSLFLAGRAPSSGGDAETMVNGDDEEKKLEDAKKLDTIVITGKVENCEAAKNALLVSWPRGYKNLFHALFN